MSQEMIAELAADFATKRKAFLTTHKVDRLSTEAREAYNASEDAEEALMDAIHDKAMEEPDWLVGVLRP